MSAAHEDAPCAKRFGHFRIVQGVAYEEHLLRAAVKPQLADEVVSARKLGRAVKVVDAVDRVEERNYAGGGDVAMEQVFAQRTQDGLPDAGAAGERQRRARIRAEVLLLLRGDGLMVFDASPVPILISTS